MVQQPTAIGLVAFFLPYPILFLHILVEYCAYMDTGLIPITALLVLSTLVAVMTYITDSRDALLTVVLFSFCRYIGTCIEDIVRFVDFYSWLCEVCILITLVCLSRTRVFIGGYHFLHAAIYTGATEFLSAFIGIAGSLSAAVGCAWIEHITIYLDVVLFLCTLICTLGCLAWIPAAAAWCRLSWIPAAVDWCRVWRAVPIVCATDILSAYIRMACPLNAVAVYAGNIIAEYLSLIHI